MGTKLPPKQLDLYQGIDEILWLDWEPIGVSGIPEARDEYHSYLPQVFKLAMEDSSPLKIAEYLDWVVRERMDINSSIQKHIAIGEKILSLKKSIGL
jgi:hypothetical protein